MLEIQNINAIHKGSLLATCDVHIAPWHVTLNEVKIFEKGAQRWLGMPSREYDGGDGNKKYVELITFDNDGVKNRFKQQVMAAVDKYLASNPDLTPEEAIKASDEIPF